MELPRPIWFSELYAELLAGRDLDAGRVTEAFESEATRRGATLLALPMTSQNLRAALTAAFTRPPERSATAEWAATCP